MKNTKCQICPSPFPRFPNSNGRRSTENICSSSRSPFAIFLRVQRPFLNQSPEFHVDQCYAHCLAPMFIVPLSLPKLSGCIVACRVGLSGMFPLTAETGFVDGDRQCDLRGCPSGLPLVTMLRGHIPSSIVSSWWGLVTSSIAWAPQSVFSAHALCSPWCVPQPHPCCPQCVLQPHPWHIAVVQPQPKSSTPTSFSPAATGSPGCLGGGVLVISHLYINLHTYP